MLIEVKIKSVMCIISVPFCVIFKKIDHMHSLVVMSKSAS